MISYDSVVSPFRFDPPKFRIFRDRPQVVRNIFRRTIYAFYHIFDVFGGHRPLLESGSDTRAIERHMINPIYNVTNASYHAFPNLSRRLEIRRVNVRRVRFKTSFRNCRFGRPTFDLGTLRRFGDG